MITLKLTNSEAKLIMNEMEQFIEARGKNESIDKDAKNIVEKLQKAGISWSDNES